MPVEVAFAVTGERGEIYLHHGAEHDLTSIAQAVWQSGDPWDEVMHGEAEVGVVEIQGYGFASEPLQLLDRRECRNLILFTEDRSSLAEE